MSASEVIEIGPDVAHPARVYDYVLGGTNNFPADREAAVELGAAHGGLDNLRVYARANRAFLRRAVTYLVRETGIRQFVDIGTGIPGHDNVHGVAHNLERASRIVYVDNDAMVLAHAHSLLKGNPDGTTDYLRADLREPEVILEGAARTLDLDQPLAVLLFGVLHLIPDPDLPQVHVATLIEALAHGSYLAISHVTNDIEPGKTEAGAEAVSKRMTTPLTPRSADQVLSYFDGCELIEPGLTNIVDWHPDGQGPATAPDGSRPPYYGALARKP